MSYLRSIIHGRSFGTYVQNGMSKISFCSCVVFERKCFLRTSQLVGLTHVHGKHRSRVLVSMPSCKHVHSESASNLHPQTEEKPGLNSVKLSPNGDFVELVLEAGPALQFPSVWLHDNCQCSRCFNAVLNSRTINWQTFDVDVKPTEVQTNGDFVDIIWSNGHRSNFDVDWLRNRCFEPEKQERWLNETYRPTRKPWNSRTFDVACQKFHFNDVINSDDHLLSWLEAIAVNGVALIEGAEQKPDQNRILANRVAFIKKTHYGEEFIVKGKIGTSNLAYLPTPLQIHTDLPYYEYKPGVNLLHCVVQTKGKGGENQLTDCLNVANILKAEEPEMYDVLTKTMVEWDDIGEDEEGRFYSLYRAPMVCLDRTGKFERVNYSQQQRSSHFNVSLEKVIPWYRAHKKFTDLLHHADNTVFLKTKPGDILTFDNVRLVHGRTGYEDVEGNERYLVGVYVDWDIAYSKIRLLKKEKDPGKYM